MDAGRSRVGEVIDAYRAAASDAGREPGEIVLQGSFSWAESDEAALGSARVWKGSQPTEFFRDDWHDPAAMYEEGARQVSDDDLREAIIIASDPEEHVERIRRLVEMGATIVPLQNNSPDPIAAIGVYGEDVLPALRGVSSQATLRP
jgi:coenzyme F420-dependent glucose-6-phosphate dehydrogenase